MKLQVISGMENKLEMSVNDPFIVPQCINMCEATHAASCPNNRKGIQ